MRRFRFEAALAVLLLAAFAGVWIWQAPGTIRGSLGAEEIDAYLGAIGRNLTATPEENTELLERLRAWCDADDGQPVYMLNLMRFFDELRTDVGLEDFAGSPREANAHYEEQVTPMVLAAGGHPIFMGEVPGRNLIAPDPDVDDWSRVVLVRYPSRRQFLDLLSDPAYGPLEPYKMAALEVALVPVGSGLLLPEPRVIAGALFACLFLGVAWIRAVREHGRNKG
jgi:uncharacterized protein (DUF1330 family)